MRERPVPNVVQQRGDTHGGLNFVRYVVCKTELGDHAGREVKCPEAVRKTRMLRRLIRKIREAKLPDPPQPLKLGRIHQRHDKPSLRSFGIDTNNVMNRVAVDSF